MGKGWRDDLADYWSISRPNHDLMRRVDGLPEMERDQVESKDLYTAVKCIFI